MDYNTANQKLTGRNSQSRKLANNTYLIRHEEYIGVKLHSTEVVKLYPNGNIRLDSGGWHTSTTKDRIGAFSGYRISQNNGNWYIPINGKTYKYADGMTITATGKVTGAGKDNPKADNKLKAKIAKYAKLCAEAIPLEHPSNGDCLYCHLRTVDTDQPLGEATHNTEHLESHMEESYIVPSLVYNAMTSSGYVPSRNIQFSLVFDNPHGMLDLAKDTVKRSVNKYLQRQFGFAH